MDTPQGDTLATCPYFKTTRHTLAPGETISNASDERFSLLTVVSGCLENTHKAGRTLLLPIGCTSLKATEETTVLRISIP